MIIGITGPKLGGKGTSAAYLREQYNAEIFSMSRILFDIAHRLHLETSRENLIKIATGLREEFGSDILAQVLKQDVSNSSGSVCVIDGIRMQSEVDIFSKLPDFRLLYIDAPIESRYERSLSRGEKVGETDMTFNEFKAEENAITEQGIAALKNKAAVVIVNDNSIPDLHTKLQTLILPL
ncbi:MAG: hypothetical protein COW24_01775 [Candidatus Kerfeldbacteria bacterium CG15_BIG_FIL_POST_REV_8_21_14_020_45_12]|uniref:Dephospho-CoA kinase n=1 Tax=Candidatus Kerfeldbacteria bacterium CG15_BIG_FIL_POST_REV_8_21_14_020_45_12 TaxID=2014247 RepID=A0A2M7H4L5_9BACT|nr:MAG: hypothetical protein COW24_01775 [Candidatus Kerfeldbacteria bacterium CG15_BIG_FIL_POST_REV_8_21_14_020_45_12]PJA93650.1 MAG: hypothetical protein CO132_02055 [Candidatus Kerfeldbacteria bacterium CG_4_9_14_3_um_filter_45_8]